MDKFKPTTSEEPCFPKTIVAPTKRVSSSSTNDNMIQKRYIHGCGNLPKLSSELGIRGTWRGISAGVVV